MGTSFGLGAPLPGGSPSWRRLFHVGASSGISLVAIASSVGLIVVLLSVLSGLALVVEMARFRFPTFNKQIIAWLKPILKESEDRRLTGATYIAISALVAFLVFDEPVAIAALLFLSLGDPVAAIVGGRFRGFRIGNKSPMGTLAFFGVATAVTGVLVAGDVVSFHWALLAGAAVAALIELVPLPLDDNLTVPLVAGGAMQLMIEIWGPAQGL